MTTRSGRSISPRRALAAGGIIAALFLTGLEGAMGFLDLDPPWDSLHRAYSVSRVFVPAMVGGEPGFRTRPGHRRVFPALAFRSEHAGSFRIMSAGGSFMQGWALPDPAAQSFAAGFGRRLERDRSGTPVEVINCGAPGYAAYRIAPLVEELVRHRPDLLMVFTGHNEFWEFAVHRDLVALRPTAARVVAALEPLRLYRALGWAMESSNRRWFGWATDWGGRYDEIDDEEYATVAREYRALLGRIIATARTARVPLVLGTVPMNLRCDPDSADSSCRGASRHPRDLPADRRAAFARLVAAGDAELSARRPDAAFARYMEAFRIDQHYGALLWRIARCSEARGRLAEARDFYWRSLGRCRRGVVRAWNEILRDEARRNGVPVADAARWFEEGEPGGIPASSWFLDDTHLSLRGQRRLADRLFAERRRLLQNTVYMKGSVLDPAKISSAAASRTATSGTIHHARRSRANATRSAKRRAA